MRFPLVLAVFLCASLAPAVAADAGFLFVSGESSAVAVYRSGDLQPVANVEVGGPVRQVLCAPGCGRFYLLGPGGVQVLNAGFERLAALPRASSIALAGGFLLAADGVNLSWIDTESNEIDTALAVGFEIEQVVVPAGSPLAYLFPAEEAEVRAVDLATRRLLSGRFPLPAAAGGVLASADGAAAFASEPGGVLNLSQLRETRFGAGVAASREPAGERASWLAGVSSEGEILTESLQTDAAGDGAELLALASSAPIASAISADGESIFAAYADRIVRLDSKTGLETASAPVAGPKSIALVAPPPEQQVFIIKVAGDQAVVAGADFELRVDGPVGGLPLAITADPDVVQCAQTLLNGPTTIMCTADDVPSTVQTIVSVGATGIGSVDFTILIFPDDLPDGLTILSGNMQTVVSGAEIEMSAELRLNGIPASGEQLTVTATPAGALTCPSPLTSDLFGRVRVLCDVGTVNNLTPVTVQVTHAAGHSVTFTHTILPPTGEDGLSKLTTDPLSVLEGRNFSLSVEARNAGIPQQNLTLTATPGQAVTCDNNTTTDSVGQATFVCTALEVTSTTGTSVRISDGSRSLLFIITVVDISAGDGLSKLAGDRQFVQQNTLFPLTLLVVAREDGQPQGNLLLDVEVSPPELASCFTPVPTDASGVAAITCSAQSVNAQSNVRIVVSDRMGRSIPEPFLITISPIAPGVASTLQLLSSTTIDSISGVTVEDAFEVRALDDDGDPVPGVPVFARSDDPGVSFFSNPVLSDGSGAASFTVLFDCPRADGVIDIGLTANPQIVQVRYRIQPGDAVSLEIVQGDMQTVSPGDRTPLALVIRAVDRCQIPVGGVDIDWRLDPSDAGSFEITTDRTNSRGRASTLVRADRNVANDFVVVASAGALTPAMFNVSVENILLQASAHSGNGQQVAADEVAAQPLVVRVTNGAGQGVEGVAVRFRANPGEATFNPINTTTNADGDAMTMVRAGPRLGEVQIEAEAGGQTVRFTILVLGRLPVVNVQSFVNGASFVSGLTPGAAGTVFGVGILENVDGVVVPPFPFPTELQGVKVLINGVAAPIFSISRVNNQEQINFQVPFVIQPGVATVEVCNNGSSTIVEAVTVSPIQPGVFEVIFDGERIAAALHADFTLVTRENPARPGEVILLFVTALGPTDQFLQANVPGPTSPLAKVSADVAVSIDGSEVVNLGAYYAPNLVAVYQINIEISAGAESGLRMMTVRAGTALSQTVFLPIGQ